MYTIPKLMANQLEAVRAIDKKIILVDYKQYVLHLKGDGRPPDLMKKVVQKYGINMEQLMKQEGISGAILNVCKQIFTVRARQCFKVPTERRVYPAVEQLQSAV